MKIGSLLAVAAAVAPALAGALGVGASACVIENVPPPAVTPALSASAPPSGAPGPSAPPPAAPAPSAPPSAAPPPSGG